MSNALVLKAFVHMLFMLEAPKFFILNYFIPLFKQNPTLSRGPRCWVVYNTIPKQVAIQTLNFWGFTFTLGKKTAESGIHWSSFGVLGARQKSTRERAERRTTSMETGLTHGKRLWELALFSLEKRKLRGELVSVHSLKQKFGQDEGSLSSEVCN